MADFIVIDRIENDVAVCETEDRKTKLLPLEQLPAGSKEGDCLRTEDGRFVYDPGETRRRREQNLFLLRGLARRDEDEQER